MLRRDFLKTAGSFLATASSGVLFACSNDEGGEPVEDAALFPQGVASGDPASTSVVLWTRVQPRPATLADGAPFKLVLEVGTDEGFGKLVARRELEAGAASDYTVRVLVEALTPDTIYYYRFIAGDARSRIGRTWTAPASDANVPVRFAWLCCQDYTSGFYGAYRTLIRQDEASTGDERVRFVLHVGDFIYETRSAGFQTALDDNFEQVELIDRKGDPRELPPFPSDPEASFANSVDDYRHLYKSFLLDPQLQAARARWPFVCMWDDHEFSNDCWQTQANYTNEDGFDEPSQRRKVAANQAWFEYIPANLVHDFEPTTVQDAPYTDPIDPAEDNNTRALASLTVYRSLRFGQHMHLLLTDNRSYRSDHALDEASTAGNPLIFYPRGAVPIDAVNAFDAGRSANSGKPPSAVAGIKNTRTDSAPGSMLGAEQKQWWKDALRASDASFKVWGNSVPLLRLRLDTTGVALFDGDLLLSTDAWDGFPSERRELMAFLASEGIRNVISLSGDHHAHLAGLVHDDYDQPNATPVMHDFAVAGITSQPQWGEVSGALQSAVTPALLPLVEPVMALITYDASSHGGPKAVPNLNTLIRYGAGAATIAAMTHDLDRVEAARNPEINAHLRYADTAANGFGLATVGADAAQVELVTIERPVHDRGDDGLQVRGRAKFGVPRLEPGAQLELAEPALEGNKPFPLH